MLNAVASPTWPMRGAVAAVGAVVALAVAPATLLDDAAISFRYAARLASGAGLTYDDHEHVLGVSNALYTLALAAADRLGLSPPVAARTLGVLGVALAAVLAAELAGRLSGRRGAILAAALLLVGVPFVSLATCGLESGVAVVLGLGAFLALQDDRPALAGVLAGLALVNKLDAGLLVLALVGTAVVLHRRPPWRLLAAAALTALPWFAFSTWRYGSPLPRSFTAKLAGDATPDSYHYDPTWALRLLRPTVPLLVLAAALSWRNVTDRRVRALLGGLLAWSALQLVAASLVPLGGGYGWYLTVVIPPLAVVAGVAAPARPSGARQVGAAIALALVLAWGGASTLHDALDRDPDAGDLLDRDRIAAGRWLSDHAQRGDVVDTCYGWVAYEAIGLPISDRCGLTTDRSPGEPVWQVDSPAGEDPDCPAGTTVAAVFDGAAEADPGQPRIAVCRAMLPAHE